jgi:hypothetical protein
MLKKLVNIGDGKGVILDRTLLDFLGIPEDVAEIEVMVEDNRIIIEKFVDTEEKRRFREITKRMLEVYGDTFKKLADS